MTEAKLNQLSERIIGGAIEVHRVLGPGLLESAYERCLVMELEESGVRVERQVLLPVRYKGREIPEAFRMDLLVERQIVVELKSVEELAPAHTAQVLTYLKLTGLKLGLILNFKVEGMRKGIRRVVNAL
jgi:GxxExxY protein